MAALTLLDIVKANGADAVTGLIDETVKAHPEMTVGTARTIKGTSYKTLVRTTLPTVGFRSANQGTASTKGTYENRTVDTYFFNPRWEADVMVADSYEDGAATYMGYEAEAMIEASNQLVCKQFYYGLAASAPSGYSDAKGFPGLIMAYDTTISVDAGGTTDSTASSVWAVKFGEKATQWVFGQNGQLAMADIATQRILDASNNPYTAYVQEMRGHLGLQNGSKRTVGRIKKLTADAGKGLTDSLIAQLLALFEVGVVPDVLFMSRRSRQQLQLSRSVTIFSGMGSKATSAMENIAPTPTESNGIRIEVTDSIANTELLAL